MDVGKRIKSLREKIGYTQNKLAEWARVSQTHLRRVELGEADITVGHLSVICAALGISMKDFFSDTSEQDELASAVSALTPKQRQLLIAFLKSM